MSPANRNETLWLVALAVALTALGIMPGMGLPGALWVAAAQPLASLLWSDAAAKAYEKAGPGVWAMALVASPLWTLSLIPCWLLARRVEPRLRQRFRVAALLWAVCGLAAGIAGWTMLMRAYDAS